MILPLNVLIHLHTLRQHLPLIVPVFVAFSLNDLLNQGVLRKIYLILLVPQVRPVSHSPLPPYFFYLLRIVPLSLGLSFPLLHYHWSRQAYLPLILREVLYLLLSLILFVLIFLIVKSYLRSVAFQMFQRPHLLLLPLLPL